MRSADSSGLCVDHPTPDERVKVWTETHAEWGRAMSKTEYVARELVRMETVLERDGGITHWVLVEKGVAPNAREIYSSCESIRKKVLVAQNGKLDKGSTHGVGSVWCSPQHRRKGYTSRLLTELGSILKSWQVDPSQVFLAHIPFSVLYSDIGKEYYVRLGWYPFESSELIFSASQRHRDVATPLRADEVAQYCLVDCGKIEDELRESTSTKPTIALLPDSTTMEWYFAREDFLSKCLFQKTFATKGAVCGTRGCRIWAIFYRAFTGPPGEINSKNALYILRLCIDGTNHGPQEYARIFRAVIQMAISEAQTCGMKEVKLWNPTTQVITLAHLSNLDFDVEERETEGIPCFMWYGEGGKTAKDILWHASDKHVWC